MGELNNYDGTSLVLSPLKFWRREWFSLTVIAAIGATSFDALLIQKKHSLFTGGFLSPYTLKGPVEIIGFILLSFVADAAMIGLMIGSLFFVFYKFRFYVRGRRLIILSIALSPIILTDFIAYQLASYLGDALNLELMFELVGGNPLEIFVVGFDHIYPLILIFFGIVGSVIFLIWRLNRTPRGDRNNEDQKPTGRTVVIESSILFLIGFVLVSFIRIKSETFDSGLKRKPSVRLMGYIAETLSDVDGDGYGLISRPSDPDPFNDRIFPYAIDIPGNGIDENGVGGDLPIENVDYSEKMFHVGRWQYKPDIVFFMLESFRIDVIGAMVDGKQVTPVLDDLAERGVFARRVFSHNGYTVQSRYHLFSGSLVGLKGRTSLIDDFKENGYEVAYFSGQDESFSEDRMPIGLDRTDTFYDGRSDPELRYTTFSTPGSLGLPYSVLLEKVTSFLSNRRSDRPLFLYVNFYDTHFPYYHEGILPLINDVVLSQSQIHHERKKDLYSMYLNTVANIDRAIGVVIDEMQKTLGEELAVIVVSDHGESLFEDRFLGHGYMINDAQTQIPLIVTGLPIDIETPFDQISLRSVINAALIEAPDANRTPVLWENPKKRVFQYIGVIERPRQIAVTGLRDRTIYDFRSGLVQIGSELWRSPSMLSPSEYSDFQRLIYVWESILLTRKSGRESIDKRSS